MKIQLLSDIHLEMYSLAGARELIEAFDPQDTDALVLAGDIGCIRDIRFRTYIQDFCTRYREVVYVPGNHEYYKVGSVASAHQVLAELTAQLSNFHPLLNQHKEIAGVKFYGGTMWYRKPTAAQAKNKMSMSDYHLIPGIEPWIYDQNTEFIAGLHPDIDVVVTHHLPSYMSVAPKYAGSILNPFFVCDLDSEIQSTQPRFWLHGHTHDARDYLLGTTRVVCNPMGYPGETDAVGFRPKVMIEVPEKGA